MLTLMISLRQNRVKLPAVWTPARTGVSELTKPTAAPAANIHASADMGTVNGVVRCSEQNAAKYHLYRVFNFSTMPKVYVLQGALPLTCRSEAAQYRARF
jgi:hypothetical protein